MPCGSPPPATPILPRRGRPSPWSGGCSRPGGRWSAPWPPCASDPAPPATPSTTAPTETAGRVRAFVAAWPDDATRQRLAALELGHRKNLRLVGPTRWHVTLRFLGHVGGEQLESLHDALRHAARHQPGPVDCHLGPATAWFSRVRVLQLPAQGLDELAAHVQRATAP